MVPEGEKFNPEVEGPDAYIQEKIATWQSLLEGISSGSNSKERLGEFIQQASKDINIFLDKKSFWECASPIARISMKNDGEVSELAGQILEEMIQIFEKISGESPAIK